MEDNANKLQALLYAHGGEMKKNEIATMLDTPLANVATYCEQLKNLLEGQGLELLETPTTLSLRTSSTYAEFLSELQQKDSERDIGTAALEVLAIVLYKGEVSRAEIDYIRGVNSSGTLRQLVLRGLLERTRSTDDARAWLYTATPELLSHVDISRSEDLPEYEVLSKALTGDQEKTNHEK